MLATKPMPQASCSWAGWYSPCAGGKPCGMEDDAISFVVKASPQHRAGVGLECHLLSYRFQGWEVQLRISMRDIENFAGGGCYEAEETNVVVGVGGGIG